MPHFLAGLYERFGLNAYIQGDSDKALAWFRKLERIDPDSIRTLRNLGVLLLSVGDAEGAEAYLLREESLYGESFHRHSALADVAFARGRREDAGRRYAAALADTDASPNGRYEASLSFLSRRLELCGDEAAFRRACDGKNSFGEAELAREAGDPERAIALFEEAARLDPTHWPALNNAGTIALNALDDPDRALALFEKAFSLARSAQVARNIELAKAAIATRAARAEGSTRQPRRTS
ncbi:MAG: hypothetical protein CVV47_14075 [Spirochaetae bacterium HGW-Spirochaetae-3]|jgi:tetratricopeptide (TPR) repeat protein|nr:MAG: hypothetical protein CVV47_14075 [Spirochaetae bacterium HGW-Spirochaetae-3]